MESRRTYLDSSASVEERVKDLLSIMTLEEKVNQLSSEMITNPSERKRNYEVGHVRNPAHFEHSLEKRKSPSECAEIINEDQKRAIESSRLGIPVLQNGESLHGAQWGDATCFPQAIALASTWNRDLMREVASVIAKESRAVGIRQVLAPVVNIARDPRWGRAQETYGEDPYLTSAMGLEYVKAIEKENIVSTPKHFVANVADGGRDSNASNLSWRILREIYLPAFKKCIVEGGARSIMPAYNSVDGLPCTCNKKLLIDILRDEWGFEGFIVSDYSSLIGMHQRHYMTKDYPQAVKKVTEGGLDVELPNGGSALLELVRSGEISEERIDISVARVLKAKFELGLFEEPYVDASKADEIVRSKESIDIALKAAKESIVLLKNEKKVLPLKKDIKTLGVFGPSKDIMLLGNYSGPHDGWHGPGVLPIEGIKNIVSNNTDILIHEGNQAPEKIAEKCDAAIIFTEIFETEGGDRSDLNLPSDKNINFSQSNLNVVDSWKRNMKKVDQETLIRKVAGTGVPTIVVLLNGSAVTMSKWEGDVDAIVEAWYPGEQGGNAIAEVLFGEYNPGGKLPITFPKSVGQVPIYYNHKTSGRVYGYNDDDGKPMFPFGHGLSYTQFEYTNPKVEVENGLPDVKVSIRADVKNTGELKGDEVVQLYIRHMYASVATPIKQLQGFERISLDKNEIKTVVFELRNEDLSLWNEQMEFIVEPGEFIAMIGSSSMDIRLEKDFKI